MKGELEGIKEIMEKSEGIAMQTFDSALFKLHQHGRITMDEALKNADSPNNLRVKIKLAGNATDSGSKMDLSLEEDKKREGAAA